MCTFMNRKKYMKTRVCVIPHRFPLLPPLSYPENSTKLTRTADGPKRYRKQRRPAAIPTIHCCNGTAPFHQKHTIAPARPEEPLKLYHGKLTPSETAMGAKNKTLMKGITARPRLEG